MATADVLTKESENSEPAFQQDYKEPRTAFGLPMIKSGLKRFHHRLKKNRNEKTIVDAARRVV